MDSDTDTEHELTQIASPAREAEDLQVSVIEAVKNSNERKMRGVKKGNYKCPFCVCLYQGTRSNFLTHVKRKHQLYVSSADINSILRPEQPQKSTFKFKARHEPLATRRKPKTPSSPYPLIKRISVLERETEKLSDRIKALECLLGTDE